MNTKIEIYTYTNQTYKALTELINTYIQESWLINYKDNILHICDELIKNAIKSNYKLILILLELKNIYKSSLKDLDSAGELIDWLKEMIFSGEDKLIKNNLNKINPEKISNLLKKLMHFEKFYIDYKQKKNINQDERNKALTIFKIKRFLKKFNIYTSVEFHKNPEYIHILIQNGSPILEEDFIRIIDKRKKFAEYVKTKSKEEYFMENIDTTGGGHGLGYPLIDALLIDMGLQPSEHLYLVSAKRTMVLLNLPLQQIKNNPFELQFNS